MKVICKLNSLNDVKDSKSLKRLRDSINLLDNEDIGLKIGQEYFVYGIVFWDNTPWFYICESEEDDYPTPFAADFFDIIDSKMPKEWEFVYSCVNGIQKTEIVFPKWASDPMFYEKLIEGYEEQVKLFQEFREQFNPTTQHKK